MAIVPKESSEMRNRRDEADERKSRDTSMFLKGMVVGFGLAAVASAIFSVFQEQRTSRRQAMTPESRIRRHDEAGGVVGDLSYIIDESSGAFRDAVKALDKTFESGKAALDSIQDVINKIRD
jgi:hypothetical protein